MTGAFLNTVEKLAILVDVVIDRVGAGQLKVKPGMDVVQYPTSADPEVQAICHRVNEQLGTYRAKKGLFGRPYVPGSAEKMPA